MKSVILQIGILRDPIVELMHLSIFRYVTVYIYIYLVVLDFCNFINHVLIKYSKLTANSIIGHFTRKTWNETHTMIILLTHPTVLGFCSIAISVSIICCKFVIKIEIDISDHNISSSLICI